MSVSEMTPVAAEETYERSLGQVRAELERARAKYRAALRSDCDVPGWDRMLCNLDDEVDALEQEEAELMAAAAAAAPPPPPPPPPPQPSMKPLPEPMSAATRESLLAAAPRAGVPDLHGCAYFEGAPWDICYACEYERYPAAYDRKIRHSELIQIISAYWRSPIVGERAKGWVNETLETIVAFLDTPRAERCFTDAQIADKSFVGGPAKLLYSLRILNS